MRKTSDSLSSLDAGSKNRLKQFRSNLKRDRDERHFDREADRLIRKYVRTYWRTEYVRTESYLRNLRSSQDGKLYSQGVKDYAKLLRSMERFAKPNHTYFGWNSNYKKAKETLISIFREARLSPLSYHSDGDMIDALPKKDTHAGFTYILTGVKEKGANLEGYYAKWQKLVKEAIENGTFGRPILPAVRTQGKGNAFEKDGTFTHDCDHKTRLVSMIDLLVIMTELRFSRPVQDFMATLKWYAGGKDLDHDVASIITDMRSRWRYWVSLDYSNYDSSISAWLIHDAFEIIRCAFDNLSPEDKQMLEVIEHDFITKDFITGDGVIHSVRGVPSGSMWTQTIDTIVNYLMILTYLHSIGLDGQMLIMGDDNLIYTEIRLDTDHMARYLAKNFGVIFNASKSCQGDADLPPTFLSSEWFPEGRYREPHELIAKLLYPEKEREYSKGDVKGEEVIYSYILAYRMGMAKFFDIDRFMTDFPGLRKSTMLNMGSSNLPGLIKFLRDYSGGYWSKAA